MSPLPSLPPLPLQVFNSSSLAVFTSLGIHALLLGLALPSFSKLASEKTPGSPGTVSVIELNPAEQSRLPDLSPLPSELANLPSPSSWLDEPAGQAPLDLPPDSSLLSPADRLNLVPPPPSLPPYPAALPPLSSAVNLPIAMPPRRPPIAALPPLAAPPPPPARARELPAPRPNEQLGDRPSLPFSPPADSLTAEGIGKAPQNASQQRLQEVSGQPVAANSLPQPAKSLAAERQRRLLADTLRGAEQLRYNSEGTTDEEARNRWLAWMQQSGQAVSKNQVIPISGNYPKQACRGRLEGTAVYGVSAGGQAQLIKSSGYGLLNQQALQEIGSRNFSEATRVSVSFNYDPKVCGTATAAPVPATPPAQTEKPPAPPPLESHQTPQPSPEPPAAAELPLPAEPQKTPEPETAPPTQAAEPEPAPPPQAAEALTPAPALGRKN